MILLMISKLVDDFNYTLLENLTLVPGENPPLVPVPARYQLVGEIFIFDIQFAHLM